MIWVISVVLLVGGLGDLAGPGDLDDLGGSSGLGGISELPKYIYSYRGQNFT